jgi:hypothetical protein
MTASRREFLFSSFSALVAPVRWDKKPGANFYTQAYCDGLPLVYRGGAGLLTCKVDAARLGLDAASTRVGDVEAHLEHHLVDGLLAAELRVTNHGPAKQTLSIEFASSAHPSQSYGQERAHLPFTAGPHAVLKGIGKQEVLASDQFIGRPGENAGSMEAFYREPQVNNPRPEDARKLLLIPLTDIHHPDIGWRIALFCSPERPWRVAAYGGPRGQGGWSLTTRVTLGVGEELREKCFLLVHGGGPEVAWSAYHKYARRDTTPRVEWLDRVRVHYYDFLGPAGPEGRRGEGYIEDAKHFAEFHVGLATQHGYYPMLGDYLDPQRKRWRAMPSDSHGWFEMSIEEMRARVKLTRAAGAKAAIYMHTAGFDSASKYAPALRDAVLIHHHGKSEPYSWEGPETVGPLWHMSIASEAWRKHLLRQAQWIMELLQPDAIVLDETFGGMGFDFREGRPRALSGFMIGFLSELRRLVHSFGRDKALLASDCALASMVQWTDGEGGDHAYGSLLGQEEYRKVPVRYLAALGGKPWLACAWQFVGFWTEQMDLARKTGAGVGVSNGWIEYSGLTRLTPAVKGRVIRDIESLVDKRLTRSLS